jgi:autotransporter-associated beta strand protein
MGQPAGGGNGGSDNMAARGERIGNIVFGICLVCKPEVESLTIEGLGSAGRGRQRTAEWNDGGNMNCRSGLSIAWVAVLVLLAASPAQAGTKTFDGGTTNGVTLDRINNWNPDGIPVTTDEVLLDNSLYTLPAGLTTASAATFGNLILNSPTLTSVSLTGGTSQSITLSDGAGSTAAAAAGGALDDLLLLGSGVHGTVTVGGGSGTGKLNLALGHDGNFNVVNSDGTLVVSGILSGAYNLFKTGAGTLTLSGVNTWGAAKTFTLAAGTLNINSTTALGALNDTFQINDGTTIDNTSGAAITTANANPITINGNFTFAGGGSGTAHDLTFKAAGAVALGGATRTITTTAANSTLGFLGIISNGGIIKDGAGTLALSGVNTFTGGLTVRNGTVSGTAGANNFGANTSVITLGDATTGAGGASVLGGAFTYANPITVGSGGSGTLTLGGGTTLSPTFSGAITLNKDLVVSKTGSTGTLTLSGGVTGTGNLTLNNAGSGASAITLSGAAAINPTGTITVQGAGTGATTISAGVGANVTAISENSSSSALTVSGVLTVNSGGTTLNNAGTALVTLSGGTAGAGGGALTVNANSSGNFTLGATPLNHNGSITNSGTGSGTVTISGVIGTSVTGVTQNSPASQLILSGANTFTGGLAIKRGTAVANVSNATTVSGAAGPSACAITLGDAAGGSASLLANSFTVSNPVNLGAGAAGTLTIGANGAVTPIFSGAIALNGNNLTVQRTAGTTLLSLTGGITGTGNLTVDNSGTTSTITLSGGAVNHTGTITVQGAATGATTISSVIGSSVAGVVQNSPAAVLVLSGANTFTNGVTIQAGTVRLGHAAGLGSAASAMVTLGAASNGKLQLYGFSPTIAGLNGDSTALIEDGVAGTHTLTVSNASACAFAGVIQNGAAGTLALSKSAGGTLTLSGANTYSGPTTIALGTLQISAANNLGSGAAGNAISLGGTLASTANTYDLGASRAIVLTSNGAAIQVDAGELQISGIVSGAYGFTKTGSGTLALSATNTYAGDTILSQGTLRLSQSASLPLTTTLRIAAGATSDLNFTGTNVIYALYINGVQQAPGVYGAGNLPASLAGSGYLLAIGSLAQAGSDYWIGNGGDANWATVGNWSTNAQPGTADVAQFDGGFFGSRQPNLAANATVGGLCLSTGLVKDVTLSGTNLSIVGTTVNGNAACGILLDSSINHSLTVSAPITLLASQSWINNQATGSGYVLADSGKVITAPGTNLTVGGSGDATISGVISGGGALTCNNGGVLALNNAANTYSGDTWVKSGVLDVSAAALNAGAASAAGSNSAAVLLGDPATGTNAELRFSGTGSRNLTVQPGDGLRLIRAKSAGTHAGTHTLNTNVVYAADVAFTISGKITGPGGLTKIGTGTLTLSNTNNDYTGQTIFNEGVFCSSVYSNWGVLGCPAPGNEEVLIGATNGTAGFSLGVSGGTYTWERPIRVRSGSSGTITFDGTGNGSTWSFNGPITLERDVLMVVNANYASWTINKPLLMAGSGSPALLVSLRNPLSYTVTNNPAHTGGTRVSGPGGTLRWCYPDAAPPGTVVRFGSDTNGGPGVITLDGSAFGLYLSASAHLTLENPIAVTTNNGYLYTDPRANNLTNTYTGPILLGGRLAFGGREDNGVSPSSRARYQGKVSVDQSAGGLRAITFNAATSPYWFEGAIADGAGPAGNSLLVLVGGTSLPFSSAATHAYGTFVEARSLALLDVLSAGSSLGLGDLWLPENAAMRLNQSFHVAPGAKVGMWANSVAASMLVLSNDFVPVLRSDAAGLLALDGPSYSAINDLSALGGGQMFLGAYKGGTFAGTTLAPGAGSVYRLGGGGGILAFSSGVLTGAGSAVQVSTLAGPAGTVRLLAGNTYGGGTTVNPNSTLAGQAQTSGSPFGSSSGPVTINSGTLQLDGTNVTSTVNVGALTAIGAAMVKSSQPTLAATNTLAFDSAVLTPSNAIFLLTSQTVPTTLGGKERITVVNNPPVVVNDMVAPGWLFLNNGTSGGVGGSGGPAYFVTYDTGSDAAGTIGFKPATNAYSNVNTFADLALVGTSGIANVTNATVANMTLTSDVSVYALVTKGVANLVNDGTYRTITVGSGGLLSNPQGSMVFSNHLSFGSARGMIYSAHTAGADYSTMTFNGRLIGTNGLTLVGDPLIGAKSCYLYGDSSSSLTGTIALLQASVACTNDNAFGASGNAIYLDGGNFTHTLDVTVSRPLILGPAGGGFSTGGYKTFTYGGPITGPGWLASRVVSLGYAIVLTNPNNTYAGGTLAPAAINVAANSSLGVGDVHVQSVLSLYGDRNIGGGDCYGNNTVSRQARLSIESAGTVNFYSLAPSVGSLSGSGTINLTNSVLTLGGDNSSTIYAGLLQQMAGSSGGSLLKTGSGTFAFKGRSTLTGTTVVQQGQFVADGYMAGGVTVNNGGTLAGAGTVGAVTLNSGATFLPGGTVTNAVSTNRMAALTSSSFTLNSGAVMTFNVYGPTNYTQIVASGPVSLGGATLQVNLFYKPASTDVFNLVLNGSGSAISGTFANAPEGKQISLGGGYYGRVSYVATADATADNDVRVSDVVRGVGGTILFFK